MAISHNTIVYIVELVIYLVISPVVLYLGYKHGRNAILGYFYLTAFCTIKIVSDIVQIADNRPQGQPPSIAAGVLSSVGLSPIMLAWSGFLHEIHNYLFALSHHGLGKKSSSSRLANIAQAQIHVICAGGMVMLIVGTVHILSANTLSSADSDNKLRIAGAVVLTVLWLALLKYNAYLLFRCRRVPSMLGINLASFAAWNAIGALFIGARVVYAVVYTCDWRDSKLSPYSGSIAVRVILDFLVPLGPAVCMVLGGWQTKDKANQPTASNLDEPVTHIRQSVLHKA